MDFENKNTFLDYLITLFLIHRMSLTDEVRCLFCPTRIHEKDLESHMRDEHRMGTMFCPATRVKCMFCWKVVEEAGMEAHVRNVHKITGLQFDVEQAETTAQLVQTDEQMNERTDQLSQDHNR